MAKKRIINPIQNNNPIGNNKNKLVNPFLQVPYTQGTTNEGFMFDWINSPEYSKRLSNFKHENPQQLVKDRTSNLVDHDVTYGNYRTQARPGTVLDSPNVKIKADMILNPADFKKYGESTIRSHELSHIIGAAPGVNTKTSMHGKRYTTGYNDKEEAFINQSNINPSSQFHDRQPYEMKADLDSNRFRMFQEGVYDIRKGTPFTIDNLNKAKLQFKDDEAFNRLLKQVGDENYINMMNTIAMDNQAPQGFDMGMPNQLQAAYGGMLNPTQEQYFLGGMFGSKTGGPGIFGQGTTPGSASGIAGMGAGMLGGLIPGQNKQGNTSIGGSAAKGALSGVAAGAMFGPWGMAIGGLLGGATSLFKAKGQQKSELEEEARVQQEQSDRTSRTALAQLNYSNSSNLPMAMGGYTDDPPNKNKHQNNRITFKDINDSPYTQAAKLFDPTGVSSWPDVYYSAQELAENPSLANAGNLGFNIFGALPMVGKLAVPAKLAKIASKTANKSLGVSKNINSVIDTAPELIPFLRKPTEAVQDFTSKYITKPLTNVKPGSRSFKVDQINKINDNVNRVNLINNVSDLYSIKEAVDNKNKQTKSFSLGGNINPMAESPVGDFSHFATGGTHEENPYGGIPQGMSQDGKLRTVEAKESAFKFNEGKYIFSNRLIFE
jgi:hypothetical protein